MQVYIHCVRMWIVVLDCHTLRERKARLWNDSCLTATHSQSIHLLKVRGGGVTVTLPSDGSEISWHGTNENQAFWKVVPNIDFGAVDSNWTSIHVEILLADWKPMNIKFVGNRFSEVFRLTREHPQVLTSVWVHILSIGWPHNRDKSSRRVRVHTLLLLRYCSVRFVMSHCRSLRQQHWKSHIRILTWNFAYGHTVTRVVHRESFSSINSS